LYPACPSYTFALNSVNRSGTYTGLITGGAGNAYMGTAFTISGFSPANDLVDAVATASTATTLSFSATTSPQSGINGQAVSVIACSSQSINFSGTNGSALQQVYLKSDSQNDFTVLSLNGPGGVTLQSVAYLSLPPSPNGTILFCSNCNNVATDGASAGHLCSGTSPNNPGHGAFAKRENNEWDCN